MSYSRPEGKSKFQLYAELRKVFDEYPEYQDFHEMVEKFATDEFYNLHYVAKAYLENGENNEL